MKRLLLATAATAALAAFAVGPASAAAPGPGGGKGTALCQPVPALVITAPAGGPQYSFTDAPPAAFPAFLYVGCQIG